MRKVNVKDLKLADILTARADIFNRIQEINKGLEKGSTERAKEAHKMNRLKEKTEIIIKDHEKEFKVGEFEIISRVYLEDGECYVDITDVIEEYKQAIRDKKNGDNSVNINN